MGDFEQRIAAQFRILQGSQLAGLGSQTGEPGARPVSARELGLLLGMPSTLGSSPTTGGAGFVDALLSMLAGAPGALDGGADVGGLAALGLGMKRESAGPRAKLDLHDIQRVRQADPAEYNSTSQARVWSGSTCSAASLTAVLRSRGVPVRIADVMAAMPGGLTPELGLISRPALTRAAAQFGFTAKDDITSYQGLQDATRAGQPVLVDVTNRRFPQGHWLVVTGVNANGIDVVDSSGYDLHSMSKDEFLASWRGRAMRVLSPAEAAIDSSGSLGRRQ
jgi:hypothetical protein